MPPARVRRRQQPQPPAFGKFFREIGEDFGEDFALAALRAANAGQPDPLLALIVCGAS